jgi:bacteriocin-like protein
MNQDKNDTNTKQDVKKVPPTHPDKQQQSAELTDEDLEKVSGGALTFGREKLK